MARGERGTNPLLLLVFVGLLCGGAYNYQRNYRAETAEPRPYQGYSDEDLGKLLAAYESENRALEQRYQGSRASTGGSGRSGMLDENLRAFEAAQRNAEATREIGARLSMQQAAQAEVESEIARRRTAGEGLSLHLKRLLTI
jgi:hypothetical protein